MGELSEAHVWKLHNKLTCLGFLFSSSVVLVDSTLALESGTFLRRRSESSFAPELTALSSPAMVRAG